jgi:hypothetical protein
LIPAQEIPVVAKLATIATGGALMTTVPEKLFDGTPSVKVYP